MARFGALSVTIAPAVGPSELRRCAMVALFEAGQHSTAELADLFGVGRSTVYRALERSKSATA